MDKKWKIDPLELKVINWYRSNDRDTQEKVRGLLRRLIQLCGTQATTAKGLKIMRRTVTYRLNHAKVIHLEDALKMLALLQSKKSEPEIWNDFIDGLVFSEQVQMAWNDLEKSRQPRGRKPSKKMKEKELICQNSDQDFVKLTIKTVRSEEAIAIRYGFGNRETLRQALIVREAGCPALIQSLDENEIKVNKAFLFSAHPFGVQEQLLQQVLLKQKKKQKQKKKRHRLPVKSKQNDYLGLLQTFKTDVPLNDMEQQTQAPIMKRIETVLQHFFIHEEKHHYALPSHC